MHSFSGKRIALSFYPRFFAGFDILGTLRTASLIGGEYLEIDM